MLCLEHAAFRLQHGRHASLRPRCCSGLQTACQLFYPLPCVSHMTCSTMWTRVVSLWLLCCSCLHYAAQLVFFSLRISHMACNLQWIRPAAPSVALLWPSQCRLQRALAFDSIKHMFAGPLQICVCCSGGVSWSTWGRWWWGWWPSTARAVAQ